MLTTYWSLCIIWHFHFYQRSDSTQSIHLTSSFEDVGGAKEACRRFGNIGLFCRDLPSAIRTFLSTTRVPSSSNPRAHANPHRHLVLHLPVHSTQGPPRSIQRQQSLSPPGAERCTVTNAPYHGQYVEFLGVFIIGLQMATDIIIRS